MPNDTDTVDITIANTGKTTQRSLIYSNFGDISKAKVVNSPGRNLTFQTKQLSNTIKIG